MRNIRIDGVGKSGDGGDGEAEMKAFCFELCWLALHTPCSACLRFQCAPNND